MSINVTLVQGGREVSPASESMRTNRSRRENLQVCSWQASRKRRYLLPVFTLSPTNRHWAVPSTEPQGATVESPP
jgi:hypothetical protein